jgi:hypothetical protein
LGMNSGSDAVETPDKVHCVVHGIQSIPWLMPYQQN